MRIFNTHLDARIWSGNRPNPFLVLHSCWEYDTRARTSSGILHGVFLANVNRIFFSTESP